MQGITGFGHIAIKVTDLDRSLQFWEKGLGFAEMDRLKTDEGVTWLVYLRVTDNFYLELFPGAESSRAPGPNANGINHLCLAIEDIEATTKRMEESGIHLTSPIKRGLDGNQGAWIEDPDGNRIELMEMEPDCLQMKAIERLHARQA